jgi:hypothetical protein
LVHLGRRVSLWDDQGFQCLKWNIAELQDSYR